MNRAAPSRGSDESGELDEEGRELVEEALRRASARSAVQIVVAYTRRSGRYERAEDLVGVLSATLAVVAAWLAYPLFGPRWNDPPPATPPLWLVLACIIVGFLAGVLLARLAPELTRPFVSDAVRTDNLHGTAIRLFEQYRRQPPGPTVLIFASLFERWVWVVADPDTRERVDPELWARVRDDALEGLRQGNHRWALADAVWRCGEILADALPAAADQEPDSERGRLVVLDW